MKSLLFMLVLVLVMLLLVTLCIFCCVGGEMKRVWTVVNTGSLSVLPKNGYLQRQERCSSPSISISLE